MVVHQKVTKINMRGFYKIHSMKAQFAVLLPNYSGLERRLINMDLNVFQVGIPSLKDMEMAM